MKKTIYALLGACVMSAGQAFGQSQISGTLAGVESDTILIQSSVVGDRSSSRRDTIALQNGKFVLDLPGDKVLKQVYIYPKPVIRADGKQDALMMTGPNFILLPDKPVIVEGTLFDYKISGSPFYDDCNAVANDCKVYYAKLDSLTRLCIDMEERGVQADSIRKTYAASRAWMKSMQQLKSDYIKQHPDKDACVFLMSQMSLENMGKAIDIIDESVKTGVMAPMYQWLKAAYDKEMTRKKAKEMMAPGNLAPEFTLKDLEGKDFSLSSLKGKYVILDFWGSWCGWCIKGIPELKQAYEKYKGKVEIVGVDCNDTEKKWKDAVAQYQLPWINVRNAGEPDVSIMYGISGYPTKCVIDPEGKIVKVAVGEDPAFYTLLEELFK